MPDARFLETTQLYKKHEPNGGLPDDFGRMPRPPIKMHCGRCRSEQTFNMTNQYAEDLPRDAARPLVRNTHTNAKVVRAIYLCAACSWTRTFLLEFGPETRRTVGNPPVTTELFVPWVMKVGQSPSWEGHIAPELAKAYGAVRAALYRRGLACEGEKFGIGAFAYYRRIVESLVAEMIAAKRARLEGAARDAFDAEVTEAARDGSARIDLIKHELPEAARPEGGNPLGLLYTGFSEGLHAKTDDECVEGAEELRRLMDSVFEQIENARSTKALKDSIKTIQDKRSRVGKGDT